MIDIGGRPLLWHLLRMLEDQGVREFVIALGYRGDVIRRWFERHPELRSQVHLVETGLDTETGGRLRRLAPWLEGDEPFLFTYADGLADLDLGKLFDFHKSHGRLATVTAVHPPERFGRLEVDGSRVRSFQEKPINGKGWINGGFFALHPDALRYVDGDSCVWEREPVEMLAHDEQLMAFRHGGFWCCVDTPNERDLLEGFWNSGAIPWRNSKTGEIG
jgi:glucose-1-phosphate cytidylyltransferase